MSESPYFPLRSWSTIFTTCIGLGLAIAGATERYLTWTNKEDCNLSPEIIEGQTVCSDTFASLQCGTINIQQGVINSIREAGTFEFYTQELNGQ